MADMKLKNCPFCNQEAEIDYSYVSKVVKCKKCRAEGKRGTTEEAVKLWNTRATDSTIEAQEAEIKRLRDCLERIAEGECNINHPPECCNCAVNIAQAALKLPQQPNN